MKILVIDRDEMTSQMISSRLEAEGHKITHEAVKNEGLERLEKERFDVVFIDPSPMRDAKAMALNIRRASKSYPYIIWISHNEEENAEHVMAMGCNDYVTKPLDQADIHLKVGNASRLKVLFDSLNDTSEDFPSAGGVISKSAFNQLCLSAMDRGGRYNELAFVMAISIENYDEIKALDGAHDSEYAVSKMAHHMVRLRRRSDIVGQTGANEYSILLQRTENTKEALDAAQRFAATFDEINDFLPRENSEIKIRIQVTHLPTGDCPFDCIIIKKTVTSAL